VRPYGYLTAVAALDGDVSHIEPVPAPLLLRAVATETTALEYGAYVQREIRPSDCRTAPHAQQNPKCSMSDNGSEHAEKLALSEPESHQ
jgi:hypothetical protein